MPTSFRISVDLTNLSVVANARIFANLASTVEAVAQVGVERWQTAVKKAPLWSGEIDAYSSSIGYRMTGPYSAEISSDYKYVEDIETGRPPFDMKKMLDTSLKVRTSKAGKRYLIIPFRHNTPGHSAHAPPMPEGVYKQAKHLAASQITGHGKRLSGTGAWDIKTKQPAQVRARSYDWGGRLPAGLSRKIKPEHRSDPHAGMVRFKEASGGSSFLTFRVMVEGSSGWIKPAKPGLFIAQNVAESLQRTADADFPAAIARDLAAI